MIKTLFSWRLDALKRIFYSFAVIGPLLMGYVWWEGERIRDVVSRGGEAAATVEQLSRSRRFLGRRDRYSLDLAWTDAKGQQRRATGVGISRAFAEKISGNGKPTRKQVQIKYVAGEVGAQPIVVEDADFQVANHRAMVWTFAGMTAVGWLMLALKWRSA